MKKRYLIAVSGLLIISSCKKDETSDEGNLLSSKKLNISNRTLATANLSNPFDWENVQVMPTAPNQPQIFPPWGSGASRQITEEIVQDYKSVDGWELVYNTFSTTVIPSHYYFTLYNKYRGVMRMYYYNPSSATSIASSNIVHTLLSAGSAAAGSPIMNYAASDVVDYATNLTTASTIEQWQVAPGTWYAFEYEMAYDKNLSAQNFGSLNLQWPAKSNNITNIVLNGTSQGTVTGNITVPGTNLTLSPTINANSSTSVGQINLKGASDVEKVKASLSTTLYTSLKDLTTKSLTSAAATLVTKLFSGIFGGKSGAAADNVNLKVNTTIAMTGTLTNSTLLESVAFAIPGYSQTATTSLTPIYNGIMGVFYPSFKPSVTQTQYITPQVNSSGATTVSRNQYAYTINPADLKFDINPAVTAIATVNLVGSDIILNYNPTFDYIGQLEQVGTTSYWTGSSLGLNDGTAGVIGIRVTFDVIPNNGSPKSVIVKTFAANIKKVVVHETAGNEPW